MGQASELDVSGVDGGVVPTTSTVSATGQFPPDFVAQIVEFAKKDAKAAYNVEQAKLEFAGGAAWAIASFGIAMLAMVAWLGFKRTIQPSKLIALGLIVTSALLLIVLGYTDEQMSPVIGLLGTIAGYMLGSKEWDGNDAAATTAADTESAAVALRKANEIAAEKKTETGI